MSAERRTRMFVTGWLKQSSVGWDKRSAGPPACAARIPDLRWAGASLVPPYKTEASRTQPQPHLWIVVVAAVLAGLFDARPAASAESITLEVAAGEVDRENVPVRAELPPSLRECPFTPHLFQADGGGPIPVQFEQGKNPAVVWILRDKLAAGKVRQYRLTFTTEGPFKSGAVTAKDDGKRLTVNVGDKPVLVYNQAVVPSPDPKHPYYAKSGYIHPVYNPSGRPVTDDFNPDHAHQHGIMFAWRKTTFEGRETDGWDQKLGTGRVEHVKLEDFAGGPVFGSFTARLRQVDLKAPGGPKPVLDEIWQVRVYNLTDRFLFDLESTQTCASNTPVVVEEMHYGGLMLRGHADWQEKKNFDYLTSQGKTKLDGNHTRPCWVDIHGSVDGKLTGVTILDHPGNFRFPQPVRLHPSMPYFCFTPALLGAFTIEPGKPYVSRYRFCVHDGKLDPKATERIWHDYAHPAKVRIVADR